MEKRGQHEDMKKDFAKLMKSCGVSLTRIPKTCLCMKCAERFWNEKKFVNGALWNVYKANKEREKGINSRRLQIIEKIYKEKVYKEKKCEQLLRQRFPCFIRKINFESKKLLPSEIINIDDLYSEFDMNHIAENNKVSQKGTKCCIDRNIAIGTSSDNFPDICGRNDSVRSEMSEQREEYTGPPSYRKSERLTTPSNSPFKNEYTKILLKDFKHIFQGQLKPTLPTVKNSKDIIHDEKSKKYYKKKIDRPVKKETRSRKKQFKREKGKRNIRKHKKRTTSKRPKKEDMEENDSELELIGADNENLTSEDMSKDDTLQDVGDKEETKGQSSTSITRAEQDKNTKRNFPNVVISAKRVEPAAFNQALVLVDEFQNLFIK